MNTETMVADAQKRVANFVARSAGQHIRSMREAHIDYEFGGDTMACNQQEMDKLAVLYDIGCKYGISMAGSRRLCDVAGISFSKLMDSTPTTAPIRLSATKLQSSVTCFAKCAA